MYQNKNCISCQTLIRVKLNPGGNRPIYCNKCYLKVTRKCACDKCYLRLRKPGDYCSIECENGDCYHDVCKNSQFGCKKMVNGKYFFCSDDCRTSYNFLISIGKKNIRICPSCRGLGTGYANVAICINCRGKKYVVIDK